MTDNNLVTPGEITTPAPPSDSAIKKVFMGPHGLRAGWRFAIFILILVAMGLIGRIVARAMGVPPPAKLTALTPKGVFTSAGLSFLFVCIATLIMAKIERRQFGDYGLPLREALGSDVWVGLLWGFLTTSGTLLAIYLFHGLQIIRSSVPGHEIPGAWLAWAVAFLVVGFNEEFTFRGYAQFTLTTGMGFWPTAILFSALFGLAHAGNSGENVLGESSVVVFGLLFCLFLRRKGNLWFPVGFHMGYDWGQTFFYGVPDSGLLPTHNLYSATFSGPHWLTGGTVGPEASVFCPIALVIAGILFHFMYREVRYRPQA